MISLLINRTKPPHWSVRINMQKMTVSSLFLIVLMAICSPYAFSAVTPPPMSAYTAFPPFINNTVPPLVMLLASKDHRLFLKAYNDITDLDGDGVVDTIYKDTIQYDGYFDWTKCYTYKSSASPSARFEPVGAATGPNGHYCTGNWSGNFLNWATMARIDVTRKVLYGGRRSVDTASTTVLSRTLLPQDGHSWAKVYNGSDIASLTPFSWSNITFCNTNTAASQTSGLIMVINGYYPYAASTENKQCLWQYNQSSSSPYGPALTVYATYNADVLVCAPSMLEVNCQTYTDTNGNHYKPAGLMQQLGVDRKGTATTSDDTIFMKFALISGSYGAHVSGGVLRSNITDVNSEIDPATGMVASTSQIIANIDRFQIVQYSWGDSWYEGTTSATSPQSNNNCNSAEILDLSTANNGICRSWGNPIGEMFYEALRYFMGKSGPTSQFQVNSPDAGLLGLTVASSWSDPYSPTGGNCPYCSKPFILMLTDPRPSYDSDQLPGSYWYNSINTNDVPSVQTLIANANINSLEGIGSVYIGQSGSTYDRSCTPKAGNFGSIRGLCIEEPTKQGSFYLAGLARYAKTTDLRTDVTGSQSVTTYSVATDPPFPTLTYTVGSQQVQVIPAFHDGCPSSGWGSPSYGGCTAQGTNGDNSGGEIVDFQYCQNDADWTTEKGNGFTSCVDILWDDADYGWDYELDVRMRIYVKTTSTSITIKTKGLYGAAGHTDYAGYFINGVTAPGQYLDLTCGGQAGFNDCDVYNGITGAADGMGNSVNTRTFSVSGSTAQVLNDPLWYAAKYGGFTDRNGNNIPDQQAEWDANSDGQPDTYFYTANPLQLQAQLGAAFVSILSKTASGTAVSVLANSSRGTGALYQAYFLPSTFDTATLNEVRWLGYLQSLFIDQYGNLREDTDGDRRLVYANDFIISTYYDNSPTSPTYGQVLVNKFADTNGDGKADSPTPTIANQPLTSLRPIWEAGSLLAATPVASRRILTWVDPTNVGIVDPGEQIQFSVANDTALGPYLNTSSSGPFTTDNVINFILGNQVTGLRNRQLTLGGTARTWKLGDIVNSTPTLVGAPHERYDILYGDPSYQAFYQAYSMRRQVIYAGANDGMLHAFNAGFYNPGDDPTTSGTVENGWFTTQRLTAPFVTQTPPLGQELWGFIPQQLLPHLRWLADPNYSHVYYVDLKPKATDIRIFCDSGSPAPTPCINGQNTSHPYGWGTVLIVGLRLGGSCGNCTTQAPPMTLNADFNGNGTTTDPTDTRTFYSGYLVLDITDPEKDPQLLWAFSDTGLGLTTSYPAIVRMNPTNAPNPSDATNAKWFLVLGSGPTDYNGGITQSPKLYAVDMLAGPGNANSGVMTFPVSTANAFMSDLTSVDRNLDYRVDVAYMGTTINAGTPPWQGKLYRLMMNVCTSAPCQSNSWGFSTGSSRVPTEILATFPSSGSTTPGPITSGVAVTMDDTNKVWIFVGTGRFWSTADKSNTETQYFFGVKDSVLIGTCAETSVTSCWNNNLLNVSNASVCVDCSGGQVSGVPGVSTLMGTTSNTLQGLIQNMDGWYIILPTLGERVVVTPTLIGGAVFFTSFTPATDICTSAGSSSLYGLFYLTGSASTNAFLGTTSNGNGTNTALRSVSVGSGTGLGSEMAVFISGQGTGGAGTASGGSGCQSRVVGVIQSSTGALNSTCTKVGPIWSRYLSWNNQRL